MTKNQLVEDNCSHHGEQEIERREAARRNITLQASPQWPPPPTRPHHLTAQQLDGLLGHSPSKSSACEWMRHLGNITQTITRTYLLWILRLNGIIQYVTFCEWLLSLSMCVEVYQYFFPSYDQCSTMCVDHTLSAHHWWTFGNLRCYEHHAVNMCARGLVQASVSSVGGIHAETDLLSHLEIPRVTFWGKLSSAVAKLFYILSRDIWDSNSAHFFTLLFFL